MLGYVYGDRVAGTHQGSPFTYRALPPSQDLAIKIASPAGSLVGQLLFGWLADVLGRKRMCESALQAIFFDLRFISYCDLDGIELTIMIIGTFAQALSGEGAAVNIIGVLFVWRFIVSYPSYFSSPLAYVPPCLPNLLATI